MKKNNNKFKNRFKSKNKLKITDEINSIKSLREKVGEIDPDSITNFSSLPLSDATHKGLKENGFIEPTKVQRLSLIHSLRGLDVVGAAKTGSGKTLAFIIPVLELLYLKNWNNFDGLGALVITPTRELAYQIYEVLNKVGKHHSFSAGLVIGGKDLKYEWTRIQCNILICTPGRLLHHMTENPDFSTDNLQMLVLDEADLCLSLGFEDAMNTILGELPPERQTLLFSATQTRNLENLIRAGCNNPIFCSVHEFSKTVTPKTLQESYVVYDESQKINFLFSFLRHHKKFKILVFLSTCKQVKFIFDLFTHLRPGLTVMGLHGNMNQLRRMAVFDEFCKKKRAVLFATDVASRGLDIPSVDWVLQLDCPEDIKTYIHRVGRTARHTRTGEALLILTPSQEEPMVNSLKANNIPIEKIIVNSRELQDIRGTIESHVSKFFGLKDEAERAFKHYIKSFCYSSMKSKNVFDVTSLDLDLYARSLGLEITPKYQFLNKFLKRNCLKLKNDTTTSNHREPVKEAQNTVKASSITITENDDGENEFVHGSEAHLVNTDVNPEEVLNDYSFYINPKKEIVNKSYVIKKLQNKNLELNKRVVFDDEGNVSSKLKKNEEDSMEGKKPSINLAERLEFLKAQDALDKKQNSLRIKEKHKLEKEKLKALKQKKKNEDDNEDEDMLEEDDDYESEDEDSYTNQIIDDLPDPDEIYNNKNESDSNRDSDSEEENDQFDIITEKESKRKKEKNKKETTDEVTIENKEKFKNKEENSKEKKTKSKQNFSGKRKAKEEAKAAKKTKLSAENDLSSISFSEKESLALYLLQGT